MEIDSSFVIVTGQDIAPNRAAVLTSDCSAFQSDCACPTDGFVDSAQQMEYSLAPYRLPDLHMATYDNGYHLAFNPHGHAGVIVLNDAAKELLTAFRQPRTLTEGAYMARKPTDGLAAAQRLADLHLIEPVNHQYQRQFSSPQTLTAWLHVTNECNLRCSYCYVHKTPDELDLERGRQAVEAVFRSARANDFRRINLKYAGGEATLNFPTVLALHDHAQQLAAKHELKLDGVVLTNGIAISKQMIRSLQSRNLRLMISLDGIGVYHDRQRAFSNGRGSFAQVERTLERLAACNFTPSISVTVSNRNLDGLPEVVNYLLSRSLPFTVNFYRESECSATIRDLAYQDDRIIQAMKAAFAVIENNLPTYSLLGALVDRAQLDVPHNRPCGAGHSYMVIDHNGGVAKCQMEINQTIADISAPDPLRLIRAAEIGVQNPAVEEKEGCRTCTWRNWCAGGCPALTYRMTGRYDVKSPNCRVYQTLFPEVLRLEGLRLLKYSSVNHACPA
jgi:uncharacterized protein